MTAHPYKAPILTAIAFFGTLGVLSVGYSAYVSNYPSTATAGVTSLSAGEWNKMVTALQTLDTNLSTFSFSWSKVGIGVNPNAAVLDLKSISWNQLDPLLSMRTGLNPYANIAFYQNLAAGQTNPAILNWDSALIFTHDTSSTSYTNGFVIAGWSNRWGLKIMEDGNVGIWIASPSERLDIGGGNIKMGYEIVTNDCVGTSVNTCSVICPTWKYVTWWGCVVDNSVKYVHRTYPSGSSQWTCHSQWNLENAGSILRAYAICSNIR